MQTTPTADSVQYQAPHPFYVPLEREGVESLAGEWRFRPDPKDIGGEREWFRSGVRDRVCPVPSAWQFLFDDLRDYRGPVWYERDFAVAPAWAGKRLAVVFCGVDHYAAVWVNGQLAAAHEGGYLPFAVDVSALLAADAELAELGLAVGEAGYALGAMPGCNFWGYVHPRSGLFSDIPSDNPIGWTYLHALAASGDDHAPTRPKMLSGLGSAAQDDVLVGCYSEWIRTRAIDAEGAVEPGEVGGLVVQCRYGRGRVVLSTLDLLVPAEVDPVAAILSIIAAGISRRKRVCRYTETITSVCEFRRRGGSHDWRTDSRTEIRIRPAGIYRPQGTLRRAGAENAARRHR